jgi:NTP pyrophosphatase (non-canonical NTP hydrolase)
MCEINNLIELASKASSEKGFWEDYEKMLKKMKGLPKHFTQKDIDRIKLAFYNEKISLISSELGEATEAMRSGKFCQLDENGLQNIKNLLKEEEGTSGSFKYQGAYITHIKDTFEDELADSFIRLFDLCHKMGINIEKFILMKMEYNKYRSTKHGKNF